MTSTTQFDRTLLSDITTFTHTQTDQNGWTPYFYPTSYYWDNMSAGSYGLAGGSTLAIKRSTDDSGTALGFTLGNNNVEIYITFKMDWTLITDTHSSNQYNLIFKIGSDASNTLAFSFFGLLDFQLSTGDTNQYWDIDEYHGGSSSSKFEYLKTTLGSMTPYIFQSAGMTVKIVFKLNDYARVYVAAENSNFYTEVPNTDEGRAKITTDMTIAFFELYSLNNIQTDNADEFQIKNIKMISVPVTDLVTPPQGIGIVDPITGSTIIGNDPSDEDQSQSGYGAGYLDDGSGNKSIGGRYNDGVIGSGTEDQYDFSTWTDSGGNAQQWNGSKYGTSIERISFHRQLNDVGFGAMDLSIVNMWTSIFGMHNYAVNLSSNGSTFFRGYLKEPNFKGQRKYNSYFMIKEFLSKLKENNTYTGDFSITLQKNIKLIFSAAGYTNAVHSDLTKTVVGGTSGDTAVLISFNNDQKYWIIRPTTAADTFASVEAITITSGTGAGTSASVVNQSFTYDTIASISGTQITLNGNYTDEVTASSSYGVLIIPNPTSTPASTDEDFDTLVTGSGTIADVNNDDNTRLTFALAGTNSLEIQGTYSGTRADVKNIECEFKWYLDLLPVPFTSKTFIIYMYNYTTLTYDTIKTITIDGGIGGKGMESGIISISGTMTDYIASSGNYFKFKLYSTAIDGNMYCYYANVVVYTDPKYNDAAGFPLSSKTSTTLTSTINFANKSVNAGDTIVIGKRNDLVLAALLNEWLGPENFTITIDSQIVGYTATDFVSLKYTSWDAIQSILAKENAYLYVDYINSIIYITKRTNLSNYNIIFTNVPGKGVVTSEPSVSFKEGDDYFGVEVLGATYKGANGQDIQIYYKAYRSGTFGKLLTIRDSTILSQTEAQQRCESELAKLGTSTTPRMPTFTFELLTAEFNTLQLGFLAYYQYHGKLWGPMPIQAIDAEQYNNNWRFILTLGWSNF